MTNATSTMLISVSQIALEKKAGDALTCFILILDLHHLLAKHDLVRVQRKALFSFAHKTDRHVSVSPLIQQINQHSNCEGPGDDPTLAILPTSKAWRKILRDLRRDVQRKGNFQTIILSSVWWRRESVKSEYVWSWTQQLPFVRWPSVRQGSDLKLT